LGADAPFDQNTRMIEGLVSACRYQLTEPEIDRFRLLGKDAGELVGELMQRLEPGETESKVARRVQDCLAARNIHCVVCLVAGDDRIRKYRHPVPTDRQWRKTLMVVVCARRHGLVASLTRIICVGDEPDDLKVRTLASAQVNAKLFSATKPGATGAALYELISKSYADAGFPNEQLRHHQGGACGYRTRDWVAHPASVDSVQVNQAFAWNPSVTGSKVEETCIAFSGGVEIITASPGWPSLSIEVDDHRYLLPGVLSR
jgi:antitoxin VapB